VLLVELAVRDAFHGALRADRHEGGRLDVAVRGGHAPAAREAVGVRQLEAEC
jgi:sugar/nucleoside kinase (ribokinase family)